MEVVGVEIVGRFFLRALDLGQPEARLDGGHDAHRDTILQLEYLGEVAIEPIGPDMAAGSGLDELSRNAHSPARFADRTLEDIADAQFAPDLAGVDRLVLVNEGRVPGDDEQPSDPLSAVMISSTTPSAK
jgi:hypothetical protein